MNLSYTVLSKRKLKYLVDNNFVEGWDDPRMPTISGLRRRGYTSTAIRSFRRSWSNKRDTVIDMVRLENALRIELNKTAPRVFAVIDPIKVVITNFYDDKVEEIEVINNPEDISQGTRKVPLTKEIYIERSDFMEDPPKKFFRLGINREVRLRYAYVIKCNSVIKSDGGYIKEIHCTYDPQTKAGKTPDGRKVKGIIHWVSATKCIDAEIRLYDRLFKVINPLDGEDFEKI